MKSIREQILATELYKSGAVFYYSDINKRVKCDSQQFHGVVQQMRELGELSVLVATGHGLRYQRPVAGLLSVAWDAKSITECLKSRVVI